MYFSKDDEYFLSINQQGVHSFLILGVRKTHDDSGMKTDTSSMHVLARLGKCYYFNEKLENIYLTAMKYYLGQSINANLVNEGVSRKKDFIKPIQYRAYKISYEQLLEFYAHIQTIYFEQEKKYEEIDPDFEKSHKIKAYIPVDDTHGMVKFEYQNIKDFNALLNQGTQSKEAPKHTLTLNLFNNSCRTSAIRIFKEVLGYIPAVSPFFFNSPGYKSTLHAGIPFNENFYILPTPPCAYKNLSPKQLKVLESLYKRIERLPYLNPTSEKTQKKFEALKNIYLQLAPQENLSIDSLLHGIVEFENANRQVLFEHRSQYFNFFYSTQTEKLFTNIKLSLTTS